MTSASIIALNCLGWPVVQLSLARVFTSMPDRYFLRDTWLTRASAREPRWYRSLLRIRSWKHLLPDGALLVGGRFPKGRLQSRDAAYLGRFVVETRRSELAHWAMMACFPIFYLWNPPWARVVVTLYAMAANLPCIVVQRYNRVTLQRLSAS